MALQARNYSGAEARIPFYPSAVAPEILYLPEKVSYFNNSWRPGEKKSEWDQKASEDRTVSSSKTKPHTASQPEIAAGKSGIIPPLSKITTLIPQPGELKTKAPIMPETSGSATTPKNLLPGFVSIGTLGDTFTTTHFSLKISDVDSSILTLPKGASEKSKATPSQVAEGQALLKSFATIFQTRVLEGLLPTRESPSGSVLSRVIYAAYQATLTFIEGPEVVAKLPDPTVRYLYGTYLLLSQLFSKCSSLQEGSIPFFEKEAFRQISGRILQGGYLQEALARNPLRFKDFFSLATHFSTDADWAGFVVWALSILRKQERLKAIQEEESRRDRMAEIAEKSGLRVQSNVIAGAFHLYFGAIHFAIS